MASQMGTVPGECPSLYSTLAPPRLRQPRRPAHDAILEIVVLNLFLAGADLAAHRDAGGVHRVGVSGNERVPPIKVMPVGQQAVGAGRRQPDDPIDVARSQAHAVVHLLGPVRIVLAAAGVTVEELTAYVR